MSTSEVPGNLAHPQNGSGPAEGGSRPPSSLPLSPEGLYPLPPGALLQTPAGELVAVLELAAQVAETLERSRKADRPPLPPPNGSAPAASGLEAEDSGPDPATAGTTTARFEQVQRETLQRLMALALSMNQRLSQAAAQSAGQEQVVSLPAPLEPSGGSGEKRISTRARKKRPLGRWVKALADYYSFQMWNPPRLLPPGGNGHALIESPRAGAVCTTRVNVVGTTTFRRLIGVYQALAGIPGVAEVVLARVGPEGAEMAVRHQQELDLVGAAAAVMARSAWVGSEEAGAILVRFGNRRSGVGESRKWKSTGDS